MKQNLQVTTNWRPGRRPNWKPGWLLTGVVGLWLALPARAQLRIEEPDQPDTAAFRLLVREISSLQVRVEVTKPILDLGQPYTILLRNSDRAILHATKYSPFALRVTTFNLSGLQDGSYAFEVIAGDALVRHEFDIKTRVKRFAVASN